MSRSGRNEADPACPRSWLGERHDDHARRTGWVVALTLVMMLAGTGQAASSSAPKAQGYGAMGARGDMREHVATERRGFASADRTRHGHCRRAVTTGRRGVHVMVAAN